MITQEKLELEFPFNRRVSGLLKFDDISGANKIAVIASFYLFINDKHNGFVEVQGTAWEEKLAYNVSSYKLLPEELNIVKSYMYKRYKEYNN